MKSTFYFSRLAGLTLAVVAGYPAGAQNPVRHITSGAWHSNNAMDYLSGTNSYLLANQVRPVTIAGMPTNTLSTGMPAPRMQLEVFPETMGASTLSKTYCTNSEVGMYLQHECPALSTAFFPADVRQTADGGFIVCGEVVRNWEMGSCPRGPQYDDGFLLRTDRNGTPIWYKRYETPSATSYRFSTVVEDPATGNFLVGGNGGFLMGTTAGGTPIWQQLVTAYWQGGTLVGSGINPNFSRVTRYTPPGSPQSYYVFTGAMQYTDNYPNGHASYGGGILTTVDASGTLLQNVQLSEDQQGTPRFLQLASVTDAYDGDVVFTGNVGGQWCGQHDANNTLLLKMNPLNPTAPPTFMKVYENNAGVCNTGTCSVVGSSGGTAVVVNGAGGKISVTGYGDVTSGGLHTGAIYMETQHNGTFIRYVGHDSTTGFVGRTVVYNTTNAYPAYAGTTPSSQSFLIKHKLTAPHTDCDQDVDVTVTDLTPDVVNNDATPIVMRDIAEPLTAYTLPDGINLICGNSKLREIPSAVAAVAPAANLSVVPNPATAAVDVLLPASLEDGTLRVYDFSGRLVQSQAFSGGPASVHLTTAALAPGLYSVRVQNGAETVQATFVKQ